MWLHFYSRHPFPKAVLNVWIRYVDTHKWKKLCFLFLVSKSESHALIFYIIDTSYFTDYTSWQHRTHDVIYAWIALFGQPILRRLSIIKSAARIYHNWLIIPPPDQVRIRMSAFQLFVINLFYGTNALKQSLHNIISVTLTLSHPRYTKLRIFHFFTLNRWWKKGQSIIEGLV